MEQHKNFTILLKAAIDKRLKETGIWDKVLKASKHYDEYSGLWHKAIDSLSDITLDYLNGVKSPVVEQLKPTREAIENILLKTGKHNYEECSELADAMLRDMGVGQPKDGPWKFEVHSSVSNTEAGCEYDEYVTITDGKITLYLDQQEDEEGEQKLCNLLNQLKVTLDWDREPEFMMHEYKKLYEEVEAVANPSFLTALQNEPVQAIHSLIMKHTDPEQREALLGKIERRTPPVADVKLTPEQIKEREEAINWYRGTDTAGIAGIRWVADCDQRPKENGFYAVKYVGGGYGGRGFYDGKWNQSITDYKIAYWLDESAQPLRDNTEEESAVMEKLIDKHIGGMCHLEKASIKYFLESGTINGSFRLRLISLMTFYKWHIESMQPLREKADEGGKENYRDVKVDGFPELNTVVEVWIEENKMPFHASWRDYGLGPSWHSSAYEVQENQGHIRYWRPLRLDRPIQSIHNN